MEFVKTGYYELQVIQFTEDNRMEISQRDLISPHKDFGDIILMGLRILWEKTRRARDTRPIYEFRIVWREE